MRKFVLKNQTISISKIIAARVEQHDPANLIPDYGELLAQSERVYAEIEKQLHPNSTHLLVDFSDIHMTLETKVKTSYYLCGFYDGIKFILHHLKK